MNKARVFNVLLCLGSLLVAQALMAQSVKVPIHVTDGVGSVNIKVGFGPAYTNHVDSALAEEEQPIEPPGGAFDARSITILSGLGKDTCKGGLLLNIHKGTAPNQADRWRISFKSDSNGGSVTFSWPAGLSDSAGGKWLLQDGSGSGLFPDVNMTTQTSFTYPAKSLDDQYIFIKTSDKLAYRTFLQEEIALAVDSKLKQAAEKRKPYHSFQCFTFNNPNSPPELAVKLHVEFNEAVVAPPEGGSALPLNFAPFTTATDMTGKGKVWEFGAPAGPIGLSVNICMYGDKGKTAKAGKYWWIDGSSAITPLKTKLKDGAVTSSNLLYHMPNVNNVGEELFAQGAYPSGLNIGIGQVGVDIKGKPIVKEVTHLKWKSVEQTLNKKGVLHTGGPSCLDNFITAKPIVKLLKSLPPDKHNNKLLAEAIALKVNISASIIGKTEAGLGEFTYVGGPYDGMAVTAISTIADSALSCVGTTAGDPDKVLALYNVIRSIDSAFSGPFDTTSYFSKTVMAGVRSISDVPYLHKAPGVVPVTLDLPFVDPNPIPATFTLHQNYPNPFNPTTTISFALPEDAIVTLKIYNILGQEMATLFNNELLDAGQQSADFDASAIPSGVYFYRVTAQSLNDDGVQSGRNFTSVKKMMLLK